jgi:hypothetical protein
MSKCEICGMVRPRNWRDRNRRGVGPTWTGHQIPSLTRKCFWACQPCIDEMGGGSTWLETAIEMAHAAAAAKAREKNLPLSTGEPAK